MTKAKLSKIASEVFTNNEEPSALLAIQHVIEDKIILSDIILLDEPALVEPDISYPLHYSALTMEGNSLDRNNETLASLHRESATTETDMSFHRFMQELHTLSKVEASLDVTQNTSSQVGAFSYMIPHDSSEEERILIKMMMSPTGPRRCAKDTKGAPPMRYVKY